MLCLPTPTAELIADLSQLAGFSRTICIGMMFNTFDLGDARMPRPSIVEYTQPHGHGGTTLGKIPPKVCVGPVKAIAAVHDLPWKGTREPGIAIRTQPYSTITNTRLNHTGDVWVNICRGKTQYCIIDLRFKGYKPLIEDDRDVLSPGVEEELEEARASKQQALDFESLFAPISTGTKPKTTLPPISVPMQASSIVFDDPNDLYQPCVDCGDKTGCFLRR